MNKGSEGATSAELERKAEREREKIARTAEELRDRLTPGQLVDEMMDYFRGSDASSMLHNLKGQVRDNPLALAMVGAGLTWLMAGQGYKDGDHDDRHKGNDHGSDGLAENGLHADRRFTGGASMGGETRPGEEPGLAGRIAETAGSMKDKARASMHDARDKARSALDSAEERAGSMGASAKDGWQRAGRGMHDAASGIRQSADRYAGRGSDMIGDMLEREPLILGAIGVAIGAAVGAMLPSTSFEDEHLGPARDELKAEAAAAIKSAEDEARNVAAKAADAAKKEADTQGLNPAGKPLADKAASVVKAASKEVKDSMQAGNKTTGGKKPTVG